MKTEEFDYRNNGEEAVTYNDTDTGCFMWATMTIVQTKPDHEIQASPHGARLIILQSQYPFEIDRETARKIAARLNQWADTLSLRMPHDA